MRLALLLALSCVLSAAARRVEIRLDGEWWIEDTVAADAAPSAWTHTVPVPGMANLARPAFPDVDQYLTRENIFNLYAFRLHPKEAPELKPGARQNRNYFWYRKSFRVATRKQVAILRINKAQFGTAVWLNGRKIGQHAGCFTAAYFDVTGAIDWAGDNQLIIRIGAHPGVLPENLPGGTDFEKAKWTPGIYDSVSVLLSDNPVIETIQVAPRIQTSDILVETRMKNYGGTAVRFELAHRVRPWKEAGAAGRPSSQPVELAPGETKTVRQTIAIPAAQLWSPESPFLYVLETTTGGDSASTRFGMRELRFDTATRRAYLNGKVYFMRGSNITLHRFFEDPQVGPLPWTEAWARKLLIDIPKRMNWNSMRFCIGPAPDQWLDIADEAGLLIQNEFPIWTDDPRSNGAYRHVPWDADELVRQYSEWMRDNWNHPSVVIWDANNETYDPVFGDKVIPAVRGLDLSNRPWENSYNGPSAANDPVEEHPYFQSDRNFRMTDLEARNSYGRSPNVPSGHAKIANEYGWLWLLRDGQPTVVGKPVYDRLLGPGATNQERLALNAYLVAGETEFFRAHREFAGVMHFVYLTFCYPNAYTCDNFEDIPSLKLHPDFADYAREAFKPLGVYINFWRPTVKPGSDQRITVMMVNDKEEQARGKLVLSLEREGGQELARRETPFAIPGFGQHTYSIDFHMPEEQGKCLLKAAAQLEGTTEPTLSRRKVTLTGTPAMSK